MAEEFKKRKEGKKWEDCNNLETMVVVAGIYRDGGNDADVADYLGISVQSLFVWKHKYPEFAKIVADTKEVVDRKVESALLKRALGFKCEERKQTIKNGIVIREEIVEKNILPDVTACAVWLNNRKPDDWKRNRDIVETSNGNDTIQINVIKAQKKSREIEKQMKKDTGKKGRIKTKQEE